MSMTGRGRKEVGLGDVLTQGERWIDEQANRSGILFPCNVWHATSTPAHSPHRPVLCQQLWLHPPPLPPTPPPTCTHSLLCVSLCPRSPTTGQLPNGPRLTSSELVLKQAGKLTLCVLRKQNGWNVESFSCPGCVSLSDTWPPVPCVHDRKYEHLQFCLRCRVNLHERYMSVVRSPTVLPARSPRERKAWGEQKINVNCDTRS